MDWPRNCHTEWSQSVREREIVLYYIILLICGSKKNDTGKLNLQNRKRLTDSEKELMITMWEGQREGINKEFRIHMYILLYLKWITN